MALANHRICSRALGNPNKKLIPIVSDDSADVRDGILPSEKYMYVSAFTVALIVGPQVATSS